MPFASTTLAVKASRMPFVCPSHLDFHTMIDSRGPRVGSVALSLCILRRLTSATLRFSDLVDAFVPLRFLLNMGKAFRCWCPRGNVCKKKNATIGVKQTMKDARWVVVNHLHASPQHKIAWQDVEQIVDDNPSRIASEDDEGGDSAGSGKTGVTDVQHVKIGFDKLVVDRRDMEKLKIAMDACLCVCERACVVFKDASKTIECHLAEVD